MQYNPYSWPNCQNFRVLKETGIEEHNGDVRFPTRSGNTAVSCKHNKKYEYNPYLWLNCRNFHVAKEIGVEEYDGDVRF